MFLPIYSQQMSTVTTFILRWFEMSCPELRFGGVQLLGHGLVGDVGGVLGAVELLLSKRTPRHSSSPTATALTDLMSDSVPFFFCSDFREEIFADLN